GAAGAEVEARGVDGDREAGVFAAAVAWLSGAVAPRPASRGAGGAALPASAPAFTVSSPQRIRAICCVPRRAKRRQSTRHIPARHGRMQAIWGRHGVQPTTELRQRRFRRPGGRGGLPGGEGGDRRAGGAGPALAGLPGLAQRVALPWWRQRFALAGARGRAGRAPRSTGGVGVGLGGEPARNVGLDDRLELLGD